MLAYSIYFNKSAYNILNSFKKDLYIIVHKNFYAFIFNNCENEVHTNLRTIFIYKYFSSAKLATGIEKDKG